MKPILLDKNVYKLEALHATAYWCSDRIIANISDKGSSFEIILEPRVGHIIDEKAIEDFKVMLLHNQIRCQLQERFSELEKVIVEKAFSPVIGT